MTVPGVKPGTGKKHVDFNITGVQNFVTNDPLENIKDETKKTIDDFLYNEKKLNGAEFDGIAMDPMEIFDDDAVWTNENIKEKLEQMVDKPENAAAMRKMFRNSFRNEFSKAMEQKRGRRKIQTIDRQRIFRENFRNGYNPRTGRLIVTKLPRRTVRPIKRDIFVVDISGSMYSFLGPVSQLIASLTEPQHLKVLLFDTDAVTIKNDIFVKNPAAIFFDPTTFAIEAANKQKLSGKRKRGWEGQGATSYDSANRELEENNITKGDRIVFIGDLEHNTVMGNNRNLIDDMKEKGECTTDGECIAKWLSLICKKADSCIAINPKTEVGGSSDLTCDLLRYDIPTCFSGALEGDENNNSVTGSGLKRTVKCIMNGLTGSRPKVDKRLIDACKDGKSFKPNVI